MYLRSVALVLFLTVWIGGFMTEGSVVPPSSGCERLKQAGMQVYSSPLLVESPYRLESVWTEQQVADMLCSLAYARTLNDLNTHPYLEASLPRVALDMIPIYYVIATSLLERYQGGIDLEEERIHFIEAFVDFAQETNLGDEPVPYEVAYDFTSNWVDEFGEDFLRKMDVLPLIIEFEINGDDVISPERLARAFSELELENGLSPARQSEAFAETSGLSVDTSKGILSGVKLLQFAQRHDPHMFGKMRQFAAVVINFLRTADEFGLLDLRASY